MRKLVSIKSFPDSSGVFQYKGEKPFNVICFQYGSGNGHYYGSNTFAHCFINSSSFSGELGKLAMLTTARKMKKNPIYFRDWQNNTFNSNKTFHTIFGEISSCFDIEIRFSDFKYQNNDVFVCVSLFYDDSINEPGVYSPAQFLEHNTSGHIHVDSECYLVLGDSVSPSLGAFYPKIYDDFQLFVDDRGYCCLADYLFCYDVLCDTAYGDILPGAVPLGFCGNIQYVNALCFAENLWGGMRYVDWQLWLEK